MAVYPCGCPISMAGKAHTSSCIVCKRETFKSHPEWAAGYAANRERAGHPRVTVRH